MAFTKQQFTIANAAQLSNAILITDDGGVFVNNIVTPSTVTGIASVTLQREFVDHLGNVVYKDVTNSGGLVYTLPIVADRHIPIDGEIMRSLSGKKIRLKANANASQETIFSLEYIGLK